MPYMTVMQCRSFMHIDFNEQQVPDATTLLNFRHMLEMKCYTIVVTVVANKI